MNTDKMNHNDDYKNQILSDTEYRVYGKYKVKSIFAGTDSITDLMITYAKRITSLRYG